MYVGVIWKEWTVNIRGEKKWQVKNTNLRAKKLTDYPLMICCFSMLLVSSRGIRYEWTECSTWLREYIVSGSYYIITICFRTKKVFHITSLYRVQYKVVPIEYTPILVLATQSVIQGQPPSQDIMNTCAGNTSAGVGGVNCKNDPYLDLYIRQGCKQF